MTPWLAALAALGLALAWWALARRLCTPREPDGWLQARAADGHPLALAWFRAEGPRRRREPVVLCHGVSANRFNVDLDDEVSLARALAARGFEVFALELRGRGRSRRPGLLGHLPRHGFDDYAALDVPAALEAVRARTGAERVHWVGHSMGGLVLYAHLAGAPGAPVRSAVTVASPLRVELPGWLRLALAVAARVPVPLVWGKVTFLVAPLVGWVAHPPLGLLLNTKNMSRRRLRAAAANLVDDISHGEVRHFARMARGRFGSEDGRTDYAAGLSAVSVPFLVIAGAGDRVARTAGVRAGFEALGPGPHAWRLFGRESGDAVDFGHGDLLLGDAAPRVVFPEIAAWLEAHDEAPDEARSAAAVEGAAAT